MVEGLTSPTSGRNVRIMEALQSNQQSNDIVGLPRSNRGGIRPGAGRPEGAKDRYQRLRVPADVRRTLRAQFKAEVENSSEGSKRLMRAFWKHVDSGSEKVLLWAFNSVIGRPVTSIELSGPNGGPLRVQAAAALALTLASPEQLAAIEAFSRLALPAGDGEDDAEDVAGELVEGEPGDPALEATQTIISCPVEAESAQVSEPAGVSVLDAEAAEWLEKG